MGLDLHPIFWKRLLKDDVNFSEFESLDKHFYKLIKELEEKEISDEELTEVYDLSFVIKNINGEEIELKQNGRNIKVNNSNKSEFIKLAKERRLNEAEIHYEAIRSGLRFLIKQKNNTSCHS